MYVVVGVVLFVAMYVVVGVVLVCCYVCSGGCSVVCCYVCSCGCSVGLLLNDSSSLYSNFGKNISFRAVLSHA